MKYVFKNSSEVAHKWANKTQDHAKYSGGNFFFENDTIYSYGYHFPIAKHITNYEGKDGVLFTERSYSHTTGIHISMVRSSANHLNILYCYNPEGSPEANFTHWQNEAENTVKKLETARKPELYLSALDTISRKAKTYAEFMGVKIPETLQAVLAIQKKGQYADYAKKKAEIEETTRLKKEAEQKKAFTKALNKWTKGEGRRLYGRGDRDYLRLSNTGSRIETSQAVEIPLEIAKKLWETVKAGRLKEGDKVMDYTVTHADKKEIRIGCHTFPLDYLVKFGEKHFV